MVEKNRGMSKGHNTQSKCVKWAECFKAGTIWATH